ncbi:MAG: bifunctional methylenetetrahydrofolate dehydrogenase/methenyltetrahydrofolate cyclohydrolase [Actinobacteria bacterium]|nr:bifunctional methylenetetrahydrofolate dehydrogenase/methenyltetrahydrofolate cyclohydrolase [Actinomycetota bacterium]
MAIILDGRLAASEIKAELSKIIKGKRLGLGTILVGEDPGSHSYVAGKHRDCAEVGITSIRIDLPKTATQTEILNAVAELNKNPQCTGFIVQLPLPEGVDTDKVLEAIDPKKDADGLHPLNLGKLVLNQKTINPCTPQAIIELVERNNISWAGKEVVVIGRGATVGRPLGLLLSQKKINATVTLTHTGTKNLSELTKRADIIVAAIGKAHFLTEDMVSAKAVVIDVGLTRVGEKLLGDVDPKVHQVVAAYSPVPGGVGPMTRAMLLRNVVEIGAKA